MVKRWLWLFMIGCWAQTASAAEITVTVQPERPIANESFRVVYSADGPVDAEPDFAELESVLDILGRNRQTSIQWINGKNTHTTTWALEVITRTEGEITLPIVAFGNERAPAHTFTVSKGGAPTANAEPGLILETEVDNPSPYVQEQVILTARFLRRVELGDANLTDPTTDTDAIIKRLGKDSTYQLNRGGKPYEVFERRFAVFPQTSGTVTINPMLLVAQIVRGSRSIFDPFRQAVTTRRIESEPIELDVKPIPASYTGHTWLPAKRLRLRDDWSPDEAAIQSGEPVTRTVFLWAEGLNSGQLPEMDIAMPAGAKNYPDQAQTSEQQTETGFNAIRQQKYAIIPGNEPTLSFPPTKITWWNTETDSMEIAELPERVFKVVGGAPAPAPTLPTESPVATTVAPEAIVFPDAPSVPEPNPRWRWAAYFFFLAWILTLAIWRWRSRTQTEAPIATPAVPPNVARAKRDVAGACKANDAAAAKRALIHWGRLQLDNERLTTLGQLAQEVDDPLRSAVLELNEYLYAPNGPKWDPTTLKQALSSYRDNAPKGLKLQRNVNPLPDLYRLSR